VSPPNIKGFAFSMIDEIISHGSLELMSEDSLCDFIS
jgi:hypothetical protein